MEPILLMACMGCQRVVDQFNFPIHCPRCGGRFYKQIKPSRFNIFRWVITSPKHVLTLIFHDIREKYHGNKKAM